jgi:hypothetical protein
MKVIMHYVDFHWDNYQGGSGKSFEMRFIYDVPDEMNANNIICSATKALQEHIMGSRPFTQKNSYSIQQMEII